MILFLSTKFWLAVSFFIFVVALIKLAGPVIIRALSNKAKEVAQTLNEAREIKQQAEQVLIDSKRYQQESVEYSRKLIAEAKSEAEELIRQTKEALQAELNKKTNLTKERIAIEEEKVIRTLKTDIISKAIDKIENSAVILSDEAKKIITQETLKNINELS